MRDRLVMLIQESLSKHIGKSRLLAQNIADDLERNGVIVAPLPMADWLRQELTDKQRKEDENANR